MGHRAADGPAVADLGIAHLAGAGRDERAVLLERSPTRRGPLPGQGADRHLVAVLADVVEAAEPADVDEQLPAGRGGASSAAAASARRRGASRPPACRAARWRGRRLGDARSRRRGDHLRLLDRPPHPLGRGRRSTSVTPRCDRASTTALITAGGEAMVPASPMPLTPSGFVGLGVTVRSRSNDGISAAAGPCRSSWSP